jgi:GH25 family lysozyme M1 (1,4-beta-N-acetylmuramidase)
MKQLFISIVILLFISLIVVPTQAFTAQEFTIGVQQNGDAEIHFKYHISWIEELAVRMGIANPQSELKKALENNFNKPVTVIRADGSEAQFTVSGFASVKTEKDSLTFSTPSLSFSAAEKVLKGYWFASLISTDFSPSVTQVAFPDGYSIEFYDQITIPKVGHTIEKYTHGIDVSQNQGNINWTKVKNAGFVFAYIRASWGDGRNPEYKYTDDNFQIYIKEAKQKNLFVGPYHIAYPDPYENDEQFLKEAEDEANHFLKIAGDYITYGYLRPALDIEPKNVEHLTKIHLAMWIDKWMTTVYEKTGVEPVIYFNSNAIIEKDLAAESLAKYDLWISQYPKPQAHTKTVPNREPNFKIWYKWSFWQYSEEGIVPGVQGNNEGYVDLDLFNGNVNDLKNKMVISK